MTTGKKIFKLRTERNLTQKQLADLCGFSQSALNLWENEKRKPKVEHLQKIAIALEISINHLLESDLDNSPVYNCFKKSNALDDELAAAYKNEVLTKNIDWDIIDIQMINIFKKLNESGKIKAIERIEELTEIPRYTTPDKFPQQHFSKNKNNEIEIDNNWIKLIDSEPFPEE